MWAVWSDVERWPTWTASVTRVEPLDGPLAMGARFQIRQPRLPAAVWTVTSLEPGQSWAWEACSPGMVTIGWHRLTGVGPSRAALGVVYRG